MQAICTLKTLISAASAKLPTGRVEEQDMHYLFMGGVGRIDDSSRTETIGSLLIRSNSLGGGGLLLKTSGSPDAPFVPTMQVYGPGCMPLGILEEWEISLQALEQDGSEILEQVRPVG